MVCFIKQAESGISLFKNGRDLPIYTDISHNFIDGSIPTGDFDDEVEYLDISDNLLTDIEFSGIEEKSELWYINISKNNISSPISGQDVTRPLELQFIDISHNKFYSSDNNPLFGLASFGENIKYVNVLDNEFDLIRETFSMLPVERNFTLLMDKTVNCSEDVANRSNVIPLNRKREICYGRDDCISTCRFKDIYSPPTLSPTEIPIISPTVDPTATTDTPTKDTTTGAPSEAPTSQSGNNRSDKTLGMKSSSFYLVVSVCVIIIIILFVVILWCTCGKKKSPIGSGQGFAMEITEQQLKQKNENANDDITIGADKNEDDDELYDEGIDSGTGKTGTSDNLNENLNEKNDERIRYIETTPVRNTKKNETGVDSNRNTEAYDADEGEGGEEGDDNYQMYKRNKSRTDVNIGIDDDIDVDELYQVTRNDCDKNQTNSTLSADKNTNVALERVLSDEPSIIA